MQIVALQFIQSKFSSKKIQNVQKAFDKIKEL